MISTIFTYPRKELSADFLPIIATDGGKFDKLLPTFQGLSNQSFSRPGPVERLYLQPVHSGISHIGHQLSAINPTRAIQPDQDILLTTFD